MIVSIKMTKKEKEIAEAYAKKHGLSLEQAIKDSFFEKIEDEYDAALADKALKEYERNPKTYTLEEVIEYIKL